ncbi:MAG: glycosyltransferase [Acidimicrobiales bacterium]
MQDVAVRIPESLLSSAAELSRAKARAGATVSVCLPARNEEATVGEIVAAVFQDLCSAASTVNEPIVDEPLVDEIIVVDDHSTDATAEVAAGAGARVESLVGEGGKGRAVGKAIEVAKGEIVVLLDADLVEFSTATVTRLLSPLLAPAGPVPAGPVLVKPCYDRWLGDVPGEGGRVTELCARPLLAILFPELGGICQPLAGEMAAPRSVLASLPLAAGYGVDVALLIDVAARYGAQAIAEVDLGARRHRNRPISELGPEAEAVARVILGRAGVTGRARQTPLR